LKVKSHENRRSRRGVPRHWFRPEEAAIPVALAREWRDQWRAEVAIRATEADPSHGATGDSPPQIQSPQIKTSAAPRRQTNGGETGNAAFARAIARSEFGRFYFDSKQATGAARKRSKACSR
jgi:hypothetical protein